MAAAAIDETLEITVIAPLMGVPSGTKLPAIYVFDPILMLDLVSGAKQLFDIFSGGAVPAAYVIGVGYADPDPASRRLRDCTPTVAALPAGLLHPNALGSGGAGRFLDCLRQEIIPHLEQNYPLDPSGRMLVGYSISGLFGAYTLLTRPDSFARYLLISPSLWWDNSWIFRQEASWASAHTDLPAKVMLVVGEAEERPGGGWPNLSLPDEVGLALRQVTNTRELGQRLASRNYPGLHLKTMIVPDGYHITALPGEISLGLVEAFAM
ncbi:MAG: alpha/beta hydrolase-fold protein [Xanthobacteraceae bacterium]